MQNNNRTEPTPVTEGRTHRQTRRQALALGGAAAAAAAVAALGIDGTKKAQAASDEPLILGQDNQQDSDDNTRLGGDVAVGGVLEVGNRRSEGSAIAILGTTFHPDSGLGPGTGVVGESGAGTGVMGQVFSDDELAIGVLGRSNSSGPPGPGDGNGNGIGVCGKSGSGTGVRGESTSGRGVEGQATTGPGVEGISESGVGVTGHSKAAPGGDPVAGVRGESDGGPGVWGQSAVAPGVLGLNTGNHPGVVGHSVSGGGVEGSSGSGPGVDGGSGSGPGVLGKSDTGRGVEGWSQEAAGVWGQSAGAPAVHGLNVGTFPGVVGHSWQGAGVDGQALTGPGVVGRAPGLYPGVRAESRSVTQTDPGELDDGVALQVVGKAVFSTAGAGTIPQGQNSVFVANPAVTNVSHITVTLTSNPWQRELRWVERDPGRGFTVHVTPALIKPETKFTYLVVEPRGS
jgi:hypothetical protein